MPEKYDFENQLPMLQNQFEKSRRFSTKNETKINKYYYCSNLSFWARMLITIQNEVIYFFTIFQS